MKVVCNQHVDVWSEARYLFPRGVNGGIALISHIKVFEQIFMLLS